MKNPTKNMLIFVFLISAFRFIYAIGLDLIPDEAYYWLWSTKFELSYFDHPPMVAWLIAIFDSFLPKIMAVKMVSVLSVAGASIYAYMLAAKLYHKELAFRFVVLINFTLLLFAGALVATPDSPMVFFMAGACYYFWQSVKTKKTGYWAVTGIFAGCALLSKYIAIIMFLAFLIFLFDKSNIKLWKSFKPYLALALSGLTFAPVILWNKANDWASFAFQFNHGIGGGKRPWHQTFFEFLGGQAGVVSPILFILFIIIMFKMFKKLGKRTLGGKYLLYLSSTTFLFFCLSALQKKVEPNWPAFAYLPGILLIMAYAEAHWFTARWYYKLMNINWWVLLLPLSIVLVHVYVPLFSLKKDPTDDFHGWNKLIEQVKLESQKHKQLELAANRYQYASELAFYSDKKVYCLNIDSRPNHFDFWQNKENMKGKSFLFLSSQAKPKKAFYKVFDKIEQIKKIPLMRETKTIKDFYVYKLINFKG